MLARRLNALQPSLTLKISAKAKQMKSQGLSVIDFSVGEPDFPTLDVAKQAGIQAIQDNFTGYTQVDGIPELKEAILNRLKTDEQIRAQPGDLIVCPGSKTSIFLALAAVVNRRDEVIIPAPYWVTYPEQVRLLEAEPVIVPASESNGFLLTPDDIQKAITPGTRAIILNNPSNPTGAVYSPEQLLAILQVIKPHDIYIIADEIYSKIIYDGFEFQRIVNLAPELKDRIITIDGVSKAYSMTGWRIGFALGPASIIGAMKKMQGHITSNPCSISQKAALAAYTADQSQIRERASEFQRRRDFLVSALRGIPGIECCNPMGAFYVMPNVARYFDTSDGDQIVRSAVDLAEYLLDVAHVATVPGEGFGAPMNIRISFATSMENIELGVKRIAGALGRLGKM